MKRHRFTTLAAHDWDDARHRGAIHEAFTKWFLAYDQRCFRQAASYQVWLRHLCEDAEARRLMLTFTATVGS